MGGARGLGTRLLAHLQNQGSSYIILISLPDKSRERISCAEGVFGQAVMCTKALLIPLLGAPLHGTMSILSTVCGPNIASNVSLIWLSDTLGTMRGMHTLGALAGGRFIVGALPDVVVIQSISEPGTRAKARLADLISIL